MSRALLTVVTAAALAGCEPLACTEMGCSGSLTLSVTGAAAGQVITLDLDDGVVTCVVPVAAGEVACTGDVTATIAAVDGGHEVVVMTGMTDGVPYTSVDVVVTDRAAELLSTTVTPTWSEPSYPNGEACDAPFGCRGGTASVEVPAAA